MYRDVSGYAVANSAWIPGCQEWIERHAASHWWSAYYVNIMFQPLSGPEQVVLAQMRRAIEKFYGRFSTRFDRNPRAESSRLRIPQLLLFPDKPVWKREKTSVRDVSINAGGLHYNGPMMIPRYSRFHGCPIEHLEEKQESYARHGISRIHVKPIHDASGIADYACKTIKWNRVDQDAILVLPRSCSELPARD